MFNRLFRVFFPVFEFPSTFLLHLIFSLDLIIIFILDCEMPNRTGGSSGSGSGLTKPVDYVTSVFWGIVNFGKE